MTSPLPLFSLRLRPEMLESLKKHAESRRRSVTSLIIEMLERELVRLDWEEEQARENYRAQAVAGLTDEQFAVLLSLIEREKKAQKKR